MIWLRSTDLMRKYVNLFRYDKGNSLPFTLGLITVVLVLLNLSMVVIKETDNLEKCFLAVKDFVTVLVMFSCLVVRFHKPEDSMKITRLIEEEYFIDCYQLHGGGKKRERIVNHYDRKRKELQSSSQAIIALIHAAFCAFVLRYIFLGPMGASLEGARGFPTPFVSYIPPKFDKIAFVIYIFAMHSFLLSFLALEAFSEYVSLLLGIKKIMTDFEIIYILFDEIVNDYPELIVDDYSINEKQANHNADMRGLREDLRVIVEYHQNLNRTLAECTRISGFGTLMSSFVIAIDTCFNIYLMLQANNPKAFMNYLPSCFCNNILMLLCYYSSQRISNQNEIFRRCLAKLPWLDKPQWFKQSIIIMMARANVDNEINPFGLFVLNLNSYKDLMKAAFSFGNILYRRKKMLG